MKPHATYNEFCPGGATKTLRTGAGEVHAILAFSATATPEKINLYDNTAASGNKLLEVHICSASPVIIFFPSNMPLRFSIGLTVETPANSVLHATLIY